tara:strand:+ start:2370 stop:3140 length:771 start_codon:yes stop_codon:yes gene_type:complete
MNNESIAIKVAKNEQLKQKYLSELRLAKPKLGETSAEIYWRDALHALSMLENSLNPSLRLNIKSIELSLLQSAEFGLSFSERHKEAYLEATESTTQNVLFVSLGLKFNGLRSRLIKCCGARFVETQVVHDNDTFEWRGKLKEPLYIQAKEPGEVKCCYGGVLLKDGQYVGCMLNLEELLAIEDADKQRAVEMFNDMDQSFYSGPYRKRMYEIATLRRLYTELISQFNDEEQPSISSNEVSLASEIEKELNDMVVGG